MWLRRILCGFGLHSMEKVAPPISDDEAAHALVTAKPGIHALGTFLALAYLGSRKRCRICGWEPS